MEKFISAANQLLEKKDSITADIELVKSRLYDTTELAAEQERLTEELGLVAGLVEQAIKENALTALNQTDYQKRYDALSERYSNTKKNWMRSRRRLRKRNSHERRSPASKKHSAPDNSV